MSQWLRILLALLLVVAGTAVGRGEQSRPAATVLRAEASSVVVDVVVTGQNGLPVKGLGETNFSVHEDGKLQTIGFFEAHAGGVDTHAPAPLPPGTYTNRMEAPPQSSVNVLLLDALNTEMKDQVMVRKQMTKYLRSVPAGKHIAVFTLASKLRLVKGFNTDSTSLLAALENGQVGTPQSSPLLEKQADRNQQQKMEDISLENALAGTPSAFAAARIELQHLQQFEADQLAFQTDLRVTYTLQALQEISRYLAGLPIRKNLIWLSASFPLIALPDNDLTNPNKDLRNYAEEVQKTARMLSTSRVAVYPVDARGLFPPNSFGPAVAAGSSIRQLNQQLRDDQLQFEQEAAVRQTMESLAAETGGEAIENTNDLAGALREIDGSAESYYTLAYSPSNHRPNGKARSIHIEVHGVGGRVRVFYRRSYVTSPPAEQPASPHLSETDTRRLLIAAMAHHAPPSTGLLFQVKVEEEGRTPEHGPILGEVPTFKDPASRYRVIYQAEPERIKLRQSIDGQMQGSLVILTIAYDANGRALNSQTSTLAVRFPMASYPDFLKRGIRFSHELDVPNGAASLRSGVFDAELQAIGSLELPLGATAR